MAGGVVSANGGKPTRKRQRKPPVFGDDQVVVNLIHSRYDELTPKLQLVARFFMDNPRMASYASVHEVARRVNVDPATVVRFAKAMGFNGYAALRQNLRHLYLRTIRAEDLVAAQQPGKDAVRAMVQQDLANLQGLLANLDVEAVRRAAQAIVKANRTIVIANGTFASLAIGLSQLCSSMGFRVDYHIRGGGGLAARIATLSPDDLLIGITFWRGSRETTEAVKWAHEHGIPTAVITDSTLSPVAAHADTVLVAPSEGALFFQSVTAAFALMYGLVVAVWEAGGNAPSEAVARMQDLYRRLQVLYE